MPVFDFGAFVLAAALTLLGPSAELEHAQRDFVGWMDVWFSQAAVKASLDGAKAITTEALEWAKDKILMGAERRSAVISKETAECTAFHEGGHAIVVRQDLICFLCHFLRVCLCHLLRPLSRCSCKKIVHAFARRRFPASTPSLCVCVFFVTCCRTARILVLEPTAS